MLFDNVEIIFKGGLMWINGKRFFKYPFNCQDDIFQMIEDYNNGLTIQRIVKKYKTNKTSFLKIRRAFGIKMFKGGNHLRGEKSDKRKMFVKNVLSEIEKQVPVSDIAKKHNCQKHIIRHIKRSLIAEQSC
jgi:DNA invertase Pin-like site-specific DNA recombinase